MSHCTDLSTRKHYRYCCRLSELGNLNVWLVAKPPIVHFSLKSLWWPFHNFVCCFVVLFFFKHICKVLWMIKWLPPVADDVTLGFFCILSPWFQLLGKLDTAVKCSEMSKKHVLWLITPPTCWEHRHYVMPDRALQHQEINSPLFVSTTKWIGRSLLYSLFSEKRCQQLSWRPSGEKKLLAHSKMT